MIILLLVQLLGQKFVVYEEVEKNASYFLSLEKKRKRNLIFVK